MERKSATNRNPVAFHLSLLALATCRPPDDNLSVAIPAPRQDACPTVFVDLGGIGCGARVPQVKVQNPCIGDQEVVSATTKTSWTNPGIAGLNKSQPRTQQDRARLIFTAASDFCVDEHMILTTTYSTLVRGSTTTGELVILLGPSTGTLIALDSAGIDFNPEPVDGLGTVQCAHSGSTQVCGGLLSPDSSVALLAAGNWSVNQGCGAQVTPGGLNFSGALGLPRINCVASGKASVRVVRSSYDAPIWYSVDGQAPVNLVEDTFQIPGGSQLRLEAEVGSQPVSWSCTGNAGSRLLADEETLTIGSVRSDLTCTVGTACEAPTVTLEATAEDGSPLVDLDTTTTNVIDLDPTTSVLFKVSGVGLEPTSMATLLVNGDAIDEFMGETTVVMQEILSSDAAYDLQAEVQACGAAVRSPAIQLRRM